jgi:hypothetical protein
MPDPDDILWEQSEIPEPEAPQLPPENPAPSPTEDVLDIPDAMSDLGDVARGEYKPPEIADADVPAFPQAASFNTPPPLTPQQRVHQQAFERGAERKERLGQPTPPPDWNRVAADNEAFADLGQVARAEAQDVDAGPVPEGAAPGMGSEFTPETFGDQGFGTMQMEQEGQQRDVASQAFHSSIKHSTLITEMSKEYARRLDELSISLERDRL